MSAVEDSGEYDSESCELCQDRPTQGTLSGGSPIRRTRAGPIHIVPNKGKIKRQTRV